MFTRDNVRELGQRWWVATSAATHDLGWSATISLREGMASAIADWNQWQRELASG